MTHRFSNRERLERMALEAELTAKAKAEARTSRGAAPKRSARTPAKETHARQKLVWKVLDERSKEVAAYAFPHRAVAEQHASQLREQTGKPHRVQSVKVPYDYQTVTAG